VWFSGFPTWTPWFDERRDPEGDRRFAESIARAGNVLLLEWTDEEVVALGEGRNGVSETQRLPLPELKAGALQCAHAGR
jgi:hypothetical protein